MRVTSLVVLAALSVPAVAVSACGSVVQVESSGTMGSGGGNGGSVTVTTTTTTLPTTTTTVKDAGADVDNGMVSTTYPAFKPSVPQVLSFGGAVVTSPKLVPVFFQNDTYQSELTDFVSKVGATNYWASATSEYGVGPAVGQAAVVVTDTAPTSIDDSSGSPSIQSWLTDKLAGQDGGTDPAWPPPDANTIYILHYPASTSITLSSGGMTGTSCVDFGGYHNSVSIGGQNVAYAVVPRCSGLDGLKGIDELTGAESHEIVEAATDPHPMADTAYGQVDNAHLYWELALGGGEVGDMCAQFPNAFYKFTELPYTVQRIWSDKSASAYHDPCVPALPGEVYFNSAPNFLENITIPGFGTMKGAKIPVNGTGEVDLDLFSDGDTGGPWSVQAWDYNVLTQQGSADLALSLDRSSGQNGEILHLTINVLQAGQYGASLFVVLSNLGQQQNWWVGLVGN